MPYLVFYLVIWGGFMRGNCSIVAATLTAHSMECYLVWGALWAQLHQANGARSHIIIIGDHSCKAILDCI